MSDTFDRNAARELLGNYMGIQPSHGFAALLDALEGCARPAPPQTIDRDALVALLERERTGSFTPLSRERVPLVADRILALLQPVDGVVLTRKEAADVARVLRNTGGRDNLAARLEGAS